VSFAAITLCIAFERVFIVVVLYFVIDSIRKLWLHPGTSGRTLLCVFVLRCVVRGSRQ
jgi:hypothetical protein